MKRITEKFKAALHEHDTVTQVFELTPELKERYVTISEEMIDELVKRTRSPFEAYMILHFMTESMQEAFGIRGGVIIGPGDDGNA